MSATVSKTDRFAVWLLLAICLAAIPAGLFAGYLHKPADDTRDEVGIVSPFEDRLLVLSLSGLIVDPNEERPLSSLSTIDTVKRNLRRALKDRHVKGIMLRIDSPGGTVATSQEIYDYLMALRKQGTPLVASMSDVAASGGYYVACACDRIVAQPGSITGSIGVIMNTVSLEGLEQKLGIRPQAIKSGPFKDMGSPHKPLSPEEKEILQAMIDDAYDQFVSAVAAGRRMDREKVRKLADGRIFMGRQAKDVGLVDELGGYETALDTLQRLSQERYGHKVKLRVVEAKRVSPLSLFSDLLNSRLSGPPVFDGIVPRSFDSRFHKMPLWLMQ